MLSKSKKNTMHQLISQGTFGFVYKISDKDVVKILKDCSDDNLRYYAIAEVIFCFTERKNLVQASSFELSHTIEIKIPFFLPVNHTECLSILNKIQIIEQMVLAVHQTHCLGIFHGDISLANFMYDPNNKKIVLIDWSRSTIYWRNFDTNVITDYTLNYKAPELVESSYNKVYTPNPNLVKVDVWALGCTIAQFYLKRFLYTPQFDTDVYHNIPHFEMYISKIDDSTVLKVVEKCMIIAPDKRATTDDLLSILNIFSDEIPVGEYNLQQDQCLVIKKELSPHLPQVVRNIVLEWLFDIRKDLKLLANTIFASIDLFDRTIDAFQLYDKNKYQLVASASLFICSNLYNDVISFSTLVSLTDGACSGRQIKKMIVKMMKHFRFSIIRPTIKQIAEEMNLSITEKELHKIIENPDNLMISHFNKLKISTNT